MLLRLPCPPLPYLVLGGRSRFRPGDVHEKRVLSQTFDLVLVEEGTLSMVVLDREHELGPGHFLVIPPGAAHRGSRRCAQETSFSWLHFHAPGGWSRVASAPPLRPRRLDKGKYYRKDPFDVTLPTSGQLDGAPLARLRDALAAAEHVRIDNFAHEKAFQTLDRAEVAYQAAFLGALSVLASLAPGPQPRADLADEVHEHLRENLAEPLTVAELARRFRFSEGHLTRVVTARFGRGPAHLLNHLRLEESRQLLRTTRLPVAVVARQVGFGTPSYFARCFKEKYGTGPAAYRAEADTADGPGAA